MKVLLVPSDVPEALASARMLAARCVAAGIDAVVQPAQDNVAPIVPIEEISLVVSMGGDGTFLATARLIGFEPIPILGLNYGTLGFLCGCPQRDEVELIADALAGDLVIERRTTVDAVITDVQGEEHVCTALNEVACTRGASGHVVEYTYAVNGHTLARLKADGLVVATATGSTAYALSAGGPIVSPGYRGLLVVPLAPHSLSARALVTAPSDVVEANFVGRFPSEATVFVDGRAVCEGPASIVAQRGEKEVLIANGGLDFFTHVAHEFYGYESGDDHDR